MRLLLIGKNGQLGFELQRTLSSLGKLFSFDRQTCDLSNADAIRGAVQSTMPDIIVNAAAYTAVDKAESDTSRAHAVNAVALGILGEEAKKLDSLVVHYSTDYVFDGMLDRPYTEADVTNPQCVYGRSKLSGEIALRASGARHLIFRTSWVVGSHGGNFAKTILQLARDRKTLNVVADQWGAPTAATLIADVTVAAIRRYAQSRQITLLGLYHLTAAGETNWHQYARHIVETALAAGVAIKLKPDAIHPIPSVEYPLPALRPANSRLDTSKLQAALSINLPAWQTALNPVLTKILRQS